MWFWSVTTIKKIPHVRYQSGSRDSSKGDTWCNNGRRQWWVPSGGKGKRCTLWSCFSTGKKGGKKKKAKPVSLNEFLAAVPATTSAVKEPLPKRTQSWADESEHLEADGKHAADLLGDNLTFVSSLPLLQTLPNGLLQSQTSTGQFYPRRPALLRP